MISTVIPVACLFAGVRAVGASTAAILSCAEPAVTVATTALVYGERLTPWQAIGGAAVLASVAVLQLRFRRASRGSARLWSDPPATGAADSAPAAPPGPVGIRCARRRPGHR